MSNTSSTTAAAAPPARVDFFISYTGADKGWAEWVAWQLEQKDYQTVIQAWDFKSGGVFPADMHRALQNSVRVIAILTPAYMESGFCQPEWQAAFADDPTGAKGLLVCVRVADFKPDGLLRGRTYIDLVNKSEADASRLLCERLETGRAKPATAPGFPGSGTSPTAPAFPGPSATPPSEIPTPHSPLHTSIPHNLPTLQPFFGRDEELKKIADALDPVSRTWGALIDGPGGMGKTSLAVRAAYAASPDVFKKIVFVTLKPRELDDDGVRDLSGFILSGIVELFSELARQLGHADILKAAEEQRPRLLLEALTGTQALVILDNLESLTKKERDTVFTFVKRLPLGCKAILTSRGRIGSAAEELILEKLDEEAALKTLAELATRNSLLAQTSEAERLVLYRETGGKPLLLRWTAGQIGRGHCLTFTDAIAYLRSCPEGNDPLEFIFGDLVADFSAEETRVLCALTYFTQPAKMEHIAAIAEMGVEMEAGEPATPKPTPAIDRVLRGLVNRSLVTPSDELQTFLLVPMVADFLRKKKPEIVAETGDWLEKRAYALIVENGFEKHDRFPVLDAAWPSVVPAMPRFLAGPNERLQVVCGALQYFLNFTGRWDERLALNMQAEIKALAAGDTRNAGWRAYQAGSIHRSRAQADAMLDCADRASRHWGKAFPSDSGGEVGIRERAIASQLRATGHRLKQDYAAAIVAFRGVLDLMCSLDAESEDVAVALNDLASIAQLSGDFLAAERYCNEALRVALAVGNLSGVANYIGNLASLALNRKDLTEAESLARKALSLAEKVGRKQLIADDCCRLAEALVRQGKEAEGLPYAQRAVEMYTRLGSPHLANAQAVLKKCEAATETQA